MTDGKLAAIAFLFSLVPYVLVAGGYMALTNSSASGRCAPPARRAARNG
jgi:hypothetical protein